MKTRTTQLTEAELVELQKDKARLDWLADPAQNIGDLILPRDIVERNLHSMRAAIDEAMVVDNLRRVSKHNEC